MKTIKNKKGYLKYTIEDDEIILEDIFVHENERRKGIGKYLINRLKSIAVDWDLPIRLYAEPQDITEEGLKAFYEACGFELDPDDVDGKLFRWGS